jgi:fermentation-respiration switch protein FrsA (DUF1100 family)
LRVYYPKNFDKKSGNKLPAYINVHGGGVQHLSTQ